MATNKRQLRSKPRTLTLLRALGLVGEEAVVAVLVLRRLEVLHLRGFCGGDFVVVYV